MSLEYFPANTEFAIFSGATINPSLKPGMNTLE